MKRLALVLFFCMAGMLQATTFYVALNGNDSWSGTLAAPNGTNTDGPWRTLYHARDAMSTSSTKTTTVRGGTYVLTSDLGFFSQDNGETFIPYVNETPIIDGAGAYQLLTRDVGSFHNLTIEGFTFQHMKHTDNINIHGDHVTIRWNTFLDCYGVCVGGDFQLSLIDSNTVLGQHQNYTGVCIGSANTTQAFVSFNGTGLPGTVGNTFSHNLVKNAEGGAFQGNYDGDLFDRNLMISVDTNACDWGAIYEPHSNSKLTNNVVIGNGGSLWASDGIKSWYLDDLTSNMTVSGNVCAKCGSQALEVHGGTNNTFTNNIFDLSSSVNNLGLYQPSGSGFTGMGGNVFTKNIVYTSCTVPSPLWSGLPPSGGNVPPTISHNIYYSGCGATFNTFGDTSPVFANPQFTDPANGDYSMPGGSPAFTVIGFTALPTDQGPLPNPFISTGTPPTISSFTATPASISSGASSTLAWATAGATSLSINQGVGTVTGTTSAVVSPTLSTTYTLTASNSSGSVTRAVTITVTGSTVPAPTITSFTASPSTPIVPGTAVTLTWTSTNGSTATLNGSSAALNGSQVVSPTTTTAYALVVSNSTGIASQTVTVNVGALPVISSFTASPSTIALGGSSTLALASSGGTTCSIDQGVGTVSCNSSTSVSPLTSKLYTATATNGFGSKTAQALVGVSISALVGACLVNGQAVIH